MDEEYLKNYYYSPNAVWGSINYCVNKNVCI